MKFLLFSDFHYYPGVFYGGSVENMKKLQQHAEEEKCDFIIHAGDLTHGPTLVPDFVEMYNNFHIPSYNCLGNHDTDKTSFEETVRLYNMPNEYYFFDCGGYRMIVLNPNYMRLDGEYINYSLGNYYAHGKDRDWLPPEQLKWLEETIATAPGPCILISHESFEREIDSVHNFRDVRDVISRANLRKPNSVLMCINGHYHRDFMRIIDNVCYFEINSTSYDWVNNPHEFYDPALREQYSCLKHSVVYNDQVHAIVTIEGTTIDIKGMQSSFMDGVTREMTDNPAGDSSMRVCTPNVMSAKITLG